MAESGRRAGRGRLSPGRGLADLALTVAAVGGVICIAAVVAAMVFDITLIMFKTGSMSPAIPTGSLAVVREIPASEAAVGDVVTVDRAGQLPITHRVTSVSDLGNGFTSITMRGDANADPDPEPYVVANVRTVLFAVPGLATVVVGFSNPYVMGGVTLGAALLVTWAFWPRARRRSHRAGVVVGVVLALGAGAIVVAPSAPARAQGVEQAQAQAQAQAQTSSPPQSTEVETVVRGRYLTLRSITDPQAMQSMAPGRPVPWQVGVSVAAPGPGMVHIGISAEGGLVNPGALDLEIRACDARWVAGVCAHGESLYLPLQDITVAARPTQPDGVRELDTLDSSNTTWLMITVVMPVEAVPGAEATLNIHAWGEATVPGDTGGGPPARIDPVQIGGTTTVLAETGAPIGRSIALAAAAVLAGLALSGAARVAAGLRRRRDGSDDVAGSHGVSTDTQTG